MAPALKQVVVAITIIITGTVWSGAGLCQSDLMVVENGEPKAIIALSDHASEPVRNAANTLQRYVELASRARLPITEFGKATDDNKGMRIWIGVPPNIASLSGLSQLDEDGFVIAFPDQQSIVIAGRTDWGTEFGVYEFLERYVGIQWLLPGPSGEYVPEKTTIRVPMKEVRQEPFFWSRQLSGFRGEVQNTWARRNRMHGRLEFHHNLANLFPPEKYAASHPEFFPIINGKRFIPGPGQKDWQPCFSAKGIVEEAIKNICDFFAQHPGAFSYSLGMNDNGRFCECPECILKAGKEKDFLGFTDLSDLYFSWANAVVVGVLKRYPDKWFGCLAYRELAQAPAGIDIHPRLIPMLTYDRMKWADPLVQAEGKKVTLAWNAKSPVLGWYDYIYGTPYCVPRVYFDTMAAYHRFAAEHGVRVMYAEAYPNWGEGPKLYVDLKMAWNPIADVKILLDDWYEKAVGKEAAPYLKQYYGIWEKFWTKTALNSRWFKASGIYLNFKSAAYLELITDEISISRGLLEQTRAYAKTADQRARADLLLRAFEYYEASALSYKDSGKGGYKLSTPLAVSRKRRARLIDEFQQDPVLIHPLRFDQFDGLKW